ncbi:helix-turn-helix domain-containing protein [Nocardia lijiangensis]|uniref:helix-turn-helix domain-containing protein n=1 Tax=Nocardia lijiangensis TaxID=299618 RepID=UPI0009FD3AD3|nr:helix-turn-helix domain-containing protein [Nocardia lijiangensis]
MRGRPTSKPPGGRDGFAPSRPSSDADASRSDEIWLSTQEVARRLKIPVKTLAAWAAGGRGPRYARMGRYRRYRLSDLLAWEHEQVERGGGSRSGSR